MESSAYQVSHTKAEDPSVVSASQTICTTCFNLDLACVPSERYSDAGASRAKHGTRRILTRLKYIRLSSSEGCPACAMLNEGVSIHCARVANESQSPWVAATDPYMLYIEFRPGHGVDIGLFYETEKDEMAKIIIEFYTRPGDVPAWPSLGYARDVPAKLTMDGCISSLKQWLENCSKNHSECVISASPLLPSRLLDVSLLQNGSIRLVTSSNLDRENYIALSHCWGQAQAIKTNKANLKSHFNVIAFDDLPKTFQDAASITFKLDIRYLWIDSLCIVQDDPEDWKREASKMAPIYSSAYLTLSNLHSPNNYGGCFSNRYTSDFGSLKAHVPTTSFPVMHSRRGSNFTVMSRLKLRNAHLHFSGGQRDDSPLGLRAWALQERLLSPRTLYFHYQELVWECKTHIACECGNLESYLLRDYTETSRPHSRLKARIQPSENRTSEEAVSNWLHIVSVYSTLNITRRSDILPALAGLASHFSTFIKGKYLAGLWTDDLPRSLLWRKLELASSHFDESSSDDFDLPSWSWVAATTGSVSDNGISYHLPLEQGYVQDCHFRYRFSTKSTSELLPYGIYTGTTLRITAQFIVTEYFRVYDRSRASIDIVSFRDSTVGFSPDVLLNKSGPSKLVDGEALYCLLVARYSSSYAWKQIVQVETNFDNGGAAEIAIVLKADKNGESKYRRVGLIQVPESKEWFRGADVVEVTIV